MTRRRGQLVLLAAATLAVALLPVVTATLQLGYHPDVEPTAATPAPAEPVERSLEREVAGLAGRLPARYPWRERAAAAATVRDELAPVVARLNRSQLRQSTAVAVTRNRSLATRVAREACPGGPARQFGPCVATDGLVLQERSGRTHLVAVAVDVRVVGPDRRAVRHLRLWATPRR